jgi:hypothetical protein
MISTKYSFLFCTVSGSWGKSDSFGYAHRLFVFYVVFANASYFHKGWLVGGAKPNVLPKDFGMRWQKLLTSSLFFKGVCECSVFHFFVRWGVLIFLLR